MRVCGNCGKSVAETDITCPHCDALLAAWATSTGATQPTGYEQPDYARPPVDTRLTAPNIQVLEPALDPVSDITAVPDKAAAAKLVNTIHAYVRKLESEANRAHATAPQQAKSRGVTRSRQTRSSVESDHDIQMRNVVIGITIVMIVVVLLMWSIVVTMVVTDMLNVGFIAVTIALTLAFKPTQNRIRSIFEK